MKMTYFVEGIQGSGKSTLVKLLSEKCPDHKVLEEGDYSPVELAWCAYMGETEAVPQLSTPEELTVALFRNVPVADVKNVVVPVKLALS